MEQKIRAYIDDLFAGTAPSRKSIELKEEMIQNLTEKYNDLLSEGKTPEAAFNIAIAGIGDISELLKDLDKEAAIPQHPVENRQKAAMIMAIAVMIYIISVVPVIILGTLVHTTTAIITGVVMMFILIAVATGLLIYNSMTKPKYPKKDTMVDEFRQWQTGSHELNALRHAVRTVLWTITVAIYFIFSFLTGMWYLSWIIFLVAAAVHAIINAVFAIRK